MYKKNAKKGIPPQKKGENQPPTKKKTNKNWPIAWEAPPCIEKKGAHKRKRNSKKKGNVQDGCERPLERKSRRWRIPMVRRRKKRRVVRRTDRKGKKNGCGPACAYGTVFPLPRPKKGKLLAGGGGAGTPPEGMHKVSRRGKGLYTFEPFRSHNRGEKTRGLERKKKGMKKSRNDKEKEKETWAARGKRARSNIIPKERKNNVRKDPAVGEVKTKGNQRLVSGGQGGGTAKKS